MVTLIKASLFKLWLFRIVFITCEKENILNCERIIKMHFSADKSTDNFEMGLIHYKTQDLEKKHIWVHGYYMDLFVMAQLISFEGNYFLPTLWSPNNYCITEEKDYEQICIDALNDFGFGANTSGTAAFKSFFLNHTIKSITEKSVYPNWMDNVPYDQRNDLNIISEINASNAQKVFMIQGYMYYFNRSFKALGNEYFKSPYEYCKVVVK